MYVLDMLKQLQYLDLSNKELIKLDLTIRELKELIFLRIIMQ